jgi:hypothetical protein
LLEEILHTRHGILIRYGNIEIEEGYIDDDDHQRKEKELRTGLVVSVLHTVSIADG